MRAPEPRLIYQTSMGSAYFGDAVEVLQEHCDDEAVDLVMTSPPIAS